MLDLALVLVHQDLVPLLLILDLDQLPLGNLALVLATLDADLALAPVLLSLALAFVPVRTGTGWREWPPHDVHGLAG